MPSGNTNFVTEYWDEPVLPGHVYLTYRKWYEMMIRDLCERYECEPQNAAICVNNKRWFDNHVEPLMKAGIKPSPCVVKSMAKNCGYSVRQLQQMFWSWHGEEFIPEGYGLDGVKIQHSFKISSPRRKRTAKSV